EGKFDDQFPIDVFQTGSGTSSNMNANEVIANRAIEMLGGDRFQKDKPVHPNDHVNMGQSTNDIFPTAIHVAVALEIHRELIPALERLQKVLTDKANAWDKIIKIGRTHLADATPLRLGQEIGGFARQIELSVARAKKAIEPILELPAGGTAVGTGINTHPEFGSRVAKVLGKETGLPFIEALDHFEANAQRDGLVECHGQLRTIAVTLFNGATGGQFQLNIMMPVMGHAALESVHLLAAATRAFVDFCAIEMEANPEACEASVEKSLSMVTSLNPHIGYERAAALAKEAFKTGKTIRDLCREQGVVPESTLKTALDPWSMTEPQG